MCACYADSLHSERVGEGMHLVDGVLRRCVENSVVMVVCVRFATSMVICSFTPVQFAASVMPCVWCIDHADVIHGQRMASPLPEQHSPGPNQQILTRAAVKFEQ